MEREEGKQAGRSTATTEFIIQREREKKKTETQK